MIGVLVNTVAVLVGGLVGLLVNRGIPKRFSGAIMTGIGLCTLYIGITGALGGENPIILVVSIVLGAAVGTLLKLDERLNSLGEMVERRFAPSPNKAPSKPPALAIAPDQPNATAPALATAPDQPQNPAHDSSGRHTIAQGFVTGSLLFCVGAMAIVGSINSGLTGDHSVIFTKSTLDLISSAMLAVSLGVGVMFSAATILVYQGLLVLLAQLLQPLLNDPSMLAELNCVGSVLIIGISLNIIGVSKIKVANYLPAIVFAPLIYKIANLF